MWSGSSVPSGWLECNGQSTSGFTALAAIVGANVPDLRGEFVRGWDNGRGVDTGRALGTYFRVVSMVNHNHAANDPGHVHGIPNLTSSGTSFGCSIAGKVLLWRWILDTQGSSTNDTGITIGYSGGEDNNLETRPRNISLMYIIKT